eukprot:TRINITY_DN1980_c0_g1_i2.p1 TRINITY_DN1980_c0_g1~~TRINITY_DN1980_c0_g1_i2.p1  ORF type:complete len:162 (+),score=15.66 TRINITY_DN1980_c0_g1_i2:83-568(+)
MRGWIGIFVLIILSNQRVRSSPCGSHNYNGFSEDLYKTSFEDCIKDGCCGCGIDDHSQFFVLCSPVSNETQSCLKCNDQDCELCGGPGSQSRRANPVVVFFVILLFGSIILCCIWGYMTYHKRVSSEPYMGYRKYEEQPHHAKWQGYDYVLTNDGEIRETL